MPQKNAMKINAMPAAIGIGMAVSMISTLLFSAVLAALIAGGRISPDSMGYGVLGILMMSAILGALAACAKVPGKRMIVSGASSAGYLLLLLCVTALFFGGEYQGVVATALVIFGGGIISALLPAGQGRGRKRPGKKRRYG